MAIFKVLFLLRSVYRGREKVAGTFDVPKEESRIT
jgi:hypothetical protein